MNDLAVSFPWWSSSLLNGTVGGNHSVRWFLGPPTIVFDGFQRLSTIGQMMRCDVLSFQSTTNQVCSLSINRADFIQLEVYNAWLLHFCGSSYYKRTNIEVWGWKIWKPWFQEIIIGPVCQSQVTPHDEWWIDVPLLLLDEWTYHFPIPHTRKYLIQNTREIQRFWPKFNTPQNPLLMLFSVHTFIFFSKPHIQTWMWPQVNLFWTF